MDYWLFTVTQHKTDIGLLSPDQVLKQRMSDKFWGLGERTPNRKSLKKGGKVVYYLGNPIFGFAATATLDSDSFLMNDKQKALYDHGLSFYRPDYGVLLTDVSCWETYKSARELIPHLKFIENKENWGSYFQGGVRQLIEDDYLTITGGRSTPTSETIETEDVILSSSQFALEAHLEEFMDKNWHHINFGSKLEKYRTDEQDGRQFPAGLWSIDFLCVDKTTSDFVVIELKRGKSSDTAIGQVLRYMGWVEENLAKPGQNIRGIIICQDVDEGLRYAVKGLKNVSVMTYIVDFKLAAYTA